MYKQQFEERHFRMDKIHIEKGSVQETLIIPLYGRKLCAEQFPTLYQVGHDRVQFCPPGVYTVVATSKGAGV